MQCTAKLLRLKLLIFKGSRVESRAEGQLRKKGEGEVGKEDGLRWGLGVRANGRKCLIMTATWKREKKSNMSGRRYSFSFEPLNPE